MAQLLKNPPANAEDTRDVSLIPRLRRFPKDMATHSSILVWKTPWTKELAGYSPRGYKESDMTEHAHTCFYEGINTNHTLESICKAMESD